MREPVPLAIISDALQNKPLERHSGEIFSEDIGYYQPRAKFQPEEEAGNVVAEPNDTSLLPSILFPHAWKMLCSHPPASPRPA